MSGRAGSIGRDDAASDSTSAAATSADAPAAPRATRPMRWAVRNARQVPRDRRVRRHRAARTPGTRLPPLGARRPGAPAARTRRPAAARTSSRVTSTCTAAADQPRAARRQVDRRSLGRIGAQQRLLDLPATAAPARPTAAAAACPSPASRCSRWWARARSRLSPPRIR